MTGNLTLADDRYAADLKPARQIPNPKNIVVGMRGLGDVWFLRGNLKQARFYLIQSLNIREALHWEGTAAESSLALAEIDLQEKAFKEAGMKAQNAATEFGNEKQTDQQAMAQAKLAESLVGEHKPTEALAFADAP